ncbi:nuclear transport factor 2 family protein [Polyangium aurulentum]|uniref:nuclear transport factor 2 family protein n=1 Tax=Polyangium aurulentum TaxID=2567896 RepID=UPI0010AE4A81|nr:nuclear transport factor 2 family protein [Polyangium aurulentum]UQA55273.1 nuclear transport factor 2 family protein [Polyangium aurulentum]
MHPNEELVTRFYTSFQRRDAEGMVACYHPDITFSDPVFPGLVGGEARAMWRMLCERGKDLEIEFRDVHADDSRGSAHWEARYTFSGSGRRVHNVIDATFEFRDGLIFRHTDRFDLWRWSRMAIGPAAALFGWLPPMQGAIRKKARTGLDAFIGARGLDATKTVP